MITKGTTYKAAEDKFNAFNAEFDKQLRAGARQEDAFDRAQEKFPFACYTSLESFKVTRSRKMKKNRNSKQCLPTTTNNSNTFEA